MADIIAFSGAHGTGKSTAVFEMAAAIKKENGGEVGIVCEVARRCPLPVYQVGHATSRQAQLWIFAEQIRVEIEAVQRHDTVVGDRTIVDAIAYSSVAGFHDLAHGQLALARHHVGLYRRVIFRGIADNPYCSDDGFRHQDAELRREVEQRMLELYSQLDIKVERWSW
jgi:energy-coupling factor transporter ATP-binding protein EcfA2